MPAPKQTIAAILFNARVAETAQVGAGAALIQSGIAQQFTTITQNFGRVTVSVSGGGKAYSFTAMRVEDIISDFMEAWQIWTSYPATELAALLDTSPRRTTRATFCGRDGYSIYPYAQ